MFKNCFGSFSKIYLDPTCSVRFNAECEVSNGISYALFVSTDRANVIEFAVSVLIVASFSAIPDNSSSVVVRLCQSMKKSLTDSEYNPEYDFRTRYTVYKSVIGLPLPPPTGATPSSMLIPIHVSQFVVGYLNSKYTRPFVTCDNHADS